MVVKKEKNKNDIYFYPDGIYLKQNRQNYSVLQKVQDVDLSNNGKLSTFFEHGKPQDKFEYTIDDNTRFAKVPWIIVKRMMDIAYNIFENDSIPVDSHIHMFLFESTAFVNFDKEYEKLSIENKRKAENEIFKFFKFCIPEQTINKHDLSLDFDYNDKEIQEFMTNNEYLLAGQFVFYKGTNNQNDKTIPYSSVQAPNFNVQFDDVPQAVYVFHNLGKTFSFLNDFGAVLINPFVNENNMSVLKPIKTFNYLAIPLEEKEIKQNGTINNGINMDDFEIKPEYQYMSATMTRYSDLDDAEIGPKSNIKVIDKIQNNSDKEIIQKQNAKESKIEVKDEKQTQLVNEPKTIDAEKHIEIKDDDSLAPITDEQLVAKKQEVESNKDDDSLSIITDDNIQLKQDKLQIENNKRNIEEQQKSSAVIDDPLGNFMNNRKKEINNNIKHNEEPKQTAQDIIDTLPANERLIENPDGQMTFFAKSKPAEHEANKKIEDDNSQNSQQVNDNIQEQQTTNDNDEQPLTPNKKAFDNSNFAINIFNGNDK